MSTREDMDMNFVKRQEYNENRNRPLMITREKGEKSDISYRGTPEHYVEKHKLNQKDDKTPTVGSGSSSHGDISSMQNGRLSTITKEGRSSSKLPSSIDDRSDSYMSSEPNSQHHIMASTKKVREVEADRSRSSSNGKYAASIYTMQNGRVTTIAKEEEQNILFRGKSEGSVNSSKLPTGFDGRSDSSASNEHDSQLNIALSKRKVGEEETDRFKSYHSSPRPPPYLKIKDNAIPAPYVKSKVSNDEPVVPLPYKGNAMANSHMNQKEEDHPHCEEGFGPTRVKGHYHEKEPTYQNDIPLPKPRSRRKQSKSSSTYYNDEKMEDTGIAKKSSSSNDEAVFSLLHTGNAVANTHMNRKEHHPHREEGFGPTRVNGHHHEKEPTYQNDLPLPKPRSTRRKQSKSLSTHYDDEKIEDIGIVKKSSSSRKKEHSRKGLQLLFDDEHHEKDEEERMMDKLLLHYSKKPSDFDVGKLRKKSQAHASNHIDSSGIKLQHVRSRDGPDVNPEMVPPPTRSVSLPREQTALVEPTKVYARANSFQPDNMARHVHPKLPDYDDLAAQFAAMRGR